MVTQNLLRTHVGGKLSLRRKKIQIVTALDQMLLTWATISELPSNISTMEFTKKRCAVDLQNFTFCPKKFVSWVKKS